MMAKKHMKHLLFYTILLLLLACNRRQEVRPSYGFFPVKEYGRWGYINSDGEIVIRCQFDRAQRFSEGLAAVVVDSLWGFIDSTGRIVIKPSFKKVSMFSNGLCNVVMPRDTSFKSAFIRKDGSIAFLTNYDHISLFTSDRASVTINENVCVLDTQGRVLFNTHYPYGGGSEFSDGILKVWTGDSTKYVNIHGKVIACIPGMGHDDFSGGFAKIQLNGDDYYLDTTGQIIHPRALPAYYQRIPIVSIRGIEPCFYINDKGKVAERGLHLEDWSYKGFINGLWWVKQNHQWGYINQRGVFVWKEQFAVAYSRLDLVKWGLMPLEVHKPISVSRYAGPDNFPRTHVFTRISKPTLFIDTADINVFCDRYLAFKLYLINAGHDTLAMPAQDNTLEIVQQAINPKGEWQDIEYHYDSFCGNSYHTLYLPPDSYQILTLPVFKGKFKTKLRCKLVLEHHEIYSNSVAGEVNLGQFLTPQDNEHPRGAVFFIHESRQVY